MPKIAIVLIPSAGPKCATPPSSVINALAVLKKSASSLKFTVFRYFTPEICEILSPNSAFSAVIKTRLNLDYKNSIICKILSSLKAFSRTLELM